MGDFIMDNFVIMGRRFLQREFPYYFRGLLMSLSYWFSAKLWSHIDKIMIAYWQIFYCATLFRFSALRFQHKYAEFYSHLLLFSLYSLHFSLFSSYLHRYAMRRTYRGPAPIWIIFLARQLFFWRGQENCGVCTTENTTVFINMDTLSCNF